MDPRTIQGGRFITIEGPDGSGKSTQAARLAASLRTLGWAVTLTREPGGTAVGERIRAVLLEAREAQHAPLTDALLFNAARAQLIAEVIRPALDRGEIVVCDRFADSTLAYQGYGSGLDLAALRSLQALATGGLRPDLTLLLDLPAEVGLARRSRGPAQEVTRFEAGRAFATEFHGRVRQGFLELARAEPERWRLVPSDAPPEVVAERLRQAVLASLEADRAPA